MRSHLPHILNPVASEWAGSYLRSAWLFRPRFHTAQFGLETPNTCTCRGPGYDQEWGQGQSSLINLFSLVPLALFSVLIWIFWSFWTMCLFSKSFPAQHQNNLSSPVPVSAAWHTVTALLFPGRSFQAADAYLPRLAFWHECDSYVHRFISFLYFAFHPNKLSFMNPFLGVYGKALQGSSGSTGLLLLFIACLLILGMVKGYTAIAKILMLHPRTLKTTGREMVMQARKKSQGAGQLQTPKPIQQASAIPYRWGLSFCCRWLIQSSPSSL